MTRKQAMKLIAGGIAGAIAAPLAFAQQRGNGKPQPTVCQPTDPNYCAGAKNSCCSSGQTCWGDQICCGAGTVGASCAIGKGGSKTNITCVTVDSSGSLPSNCTALG